MCIKDNQELSTIKLDVFDPNKIMEVVTQTGGYQKSFQKPRGSSTLQCHNLLVPESQLKPQSSTDSQMYKS